jgi:hypothetical protein
VWRDVAEVDGEADGGGGRRHRTAASDGGIGFDPGYGEGGYGVRGMGGGWWGG